MNGLGESNPTRREFIKKGGILMASTVALQTEDSFALAISTSNDEKAGGKKEEDISPVEDLMREHGVLARILLIFDEISLRLENAKEYPPELLGKGVRLIRRFVEDYHEKLEEDYLFPRFEKAGKLVDLVKILFEQHKAGRRLTAKISNLDSLPTPNVNEKKEMIKSLRLFSRMYRPHKSWEDTVLFPVFHSIVAPQEYDSLGEQFEDKENELFGEHGFDKVVEEVAGLEKSLGIYALDQFTWPS
jgi:hemerythrin-like domain-containing protein